MSTNSVDKSSMIYHIRSYQTFAPFMDRVKYGTMMLVLREKDIPLAANRIKAGMDIVDIFSAGVDPSNSQLLHIHTLNKGDHDVELTHTYQYWAQPATLREFLMEQYDLKIPRLNNSKKENGLLTCIELDGYHDCYLPDRYVIRTFRLFNSDVHQCPEDNPADPATGFIATAEHKKNSACPYCIAEKLNINL